ncbi:Xylose-responsive transcription regulator, ROK family [Actinomycetales bacterium JB111]|nr:Xylose-responsive transcription regulator, ROK family [Actinomycetales bacterium JB111]
MSLVSVATQPGQLVVERIRDAGPISRVEVARSTGLAPATVNRWAARMLDSGLLRTSGSDLGTGGRPSTLLRLNERFGVTLAVDVADRHIDVARLDLVGHMIDNVRIESDGELGEPRLQEVLDEIAAAVATDPTQPVLAIGVSVPGPVDRDGVVIFAPALEWNDVPLGRLLAERTGLPVVVENDANLIALAEYERGPWEDVRALVTIAVFDGVGMGIIEGGQVWRGATGAAGQVGRMLFNRSALGGTYSGFGDLELHLGRVGIAVRAVRRGILDDADPRGADTVLELAAGGNAEAITLLDELMDDYAFALINVCAILEPDVITLSGLFEAWGDLVLPRMEERMEGQVVTMPRLVAASLGETGALLGAGIRAFASSGGIASLI